MRVAAQRCRSAKRLSGPPQRLQCPKYSSGRPEVRMFLTINPASSVAGLPGDAFPAPSMTCELPVPLLQIRSFGRLCEP